MNKIEDVPNATVERIMTGGEDSNLSAMACLDQALIGISKFNAKRQDREIKL